MNIRVTNRRKLKNLSEEKQKNIRDGFSLFDTDNDNCLDCHELKAAIRALGFPIKKLEVAAIMETYDTLKTNKICFEDFYYIVSDKMLKCNPVEEVKYAFKLFLDGKSNTIGYQDLKRISELISSDLDEDDLRGMISEFDTRGDGRITEEDFIKIMTNDF